MNYQQLQSQLKALKAEGRTDIKLNSSHADLLDAYRLVIFQLLKTGVNSLEVISDTGSTTKWVDCSFSKENGLHLWTEGHTVSGYHSLACTLPQTEPQPKEEAVIENTQESVLYNAKTSDVIKFKSHNKILMGSKSNCLVVDTYPDWIVIKTSDRHVKLNYEQVREMGGYFVSKM